MAGAVIAIPQMGNDLFRKYMKSKYEKAVVNAGASVRWIELENTEEAVAAALRCDGLLLPGGADVNPEMYGESPTEKCGKPNALRDTAESEMFKEFIKTGKPVLAICRGFQLINVLQGGSLYQDIKAEQSCKHSDFLSRARHTHTVSLKENTRLYELFGSAEINVNSIHHQAVKVLGKGLKAVAVSPDGYTEAFEMENYGFCVGVQWHPEHMAKKSPAQQKIFDAFVGECG